MVTAVTGRQAKWRCGGGGSACLMAGVFPNPENTLDTIGVPENPGGGLTQFNFNLLTINKMYKSFDKLVCTGTITITYIHRHNTRYVKIYQDEFTVMIYM